MRLFLCSCTEYEERLEKCRDGLTGITLDELYADTSIVGNMMERDYVPKAGGVISTMKRAIGIRAKSSSNEADDDSPAEMIEDEDRDDE